MVSSQSKSTGFWSTLVRRFRDGDDKTPTNVYRLEDVRHAMLSLLSSDGAQRNPILAHRITAAKDAKALWYQRASLMAALSEQCGEEQAHERMEHLSSMFMGLLPKDMMPRVSRPTPLKRKRRSRK